MSDVQEKVPLPQLGTIRRLKSGGPAMTVTNVYPEDGSVFCCWFWRGRIFKEEFQAELLDPAEAETTGK